MKVNRLGRQLRAMARFVTSDSAVLQRGDGAYRYCWAWMGLEPPLGREARPAARSTTQPRQVLQPVFENRQAGRARQFGIRWARPFLRRTLPAGHDGDG